MTTVICGRSVIQVTCILTILTNWERNRTWKYIELPPLLFGISAISSWFTHSNDLHIQTYPVATGVFWYARFDYIKGNLKMGYILSRPQYVHAHSCYVRQTCFYHNDSKSEEQDAWSIVIKECHPYDSSKRLHRQSPWSNDSATSKPLPWHGYALLKSLFIRLSDQRSSSLMG